MDRYDDLSTNARRMPFDWNTNFGINANDLAGAWLNWIRQETDDGFFLEDPR